MELSENEIIRRKKIGDFNRGKSLSKEHREKISNSRKGIKFSEEHLKNLSESHKGKGRKHGFIPSTETRKLWSAQRKGRKHSEETLKKMSESSRGSKSHFWKGGKMARYPEREQQRKTPEYAGWRRKVFARDNYACRFPNCQSEGRYLIANHIKRFVDYPELRLELSNGITLCKNCDEHIRGKEWFYERLFTKLLTLI